MLILQSIPRSKNRLIYSHIATHTNLFGFSEAVIEGSFEPQWKGLKEHKLVRLVASIICCFISINLQYLIFLFGL